MVSSTQKKTFQNTQKCSTSCKDAKCGKKKFTQSSKPTKKKHRHPKGWNGKLHYMKMGGQCGQSCPCCRAQVFLQKIDPDAKWGACIICLTSKK